MSLLRATLGLVLSLLASGTTPAAVVLNEILYHAPHDRDDLQFLELHNTGTAAVDLGGWGFRRGVRYSFPPGSRIEANGYLVLCKDARQFRAHYGFEAAGQFAGTLSHSGEQVELVDAGGRTVDAVTYGSRAPWPVSPDGCSSSLERICPAAPGNSPDNWAPSPLPAGPPRAGGTPGRRNANHAPRLPPVIRRVAVSPSHAAAGEVLRVTAAVRGAAPLQAVELRYRVARSGQESAEQTVTMTPTIGEDYTATVPGQQANQIVRLRIRAVDATGAERFYPAPHELRPALSVLVHEPYRPGKVDFGLIVHVGAAEFQAARHGAGGPGADPPARGNAAFIHVPRATGVPELFDFLTVTPRPGGRKVRFHKDRPLDGMTTINLIFEGHDRFVLAEPLAYEVYRRAGNAAPRTDYLRTWVDGRPLGYQLLVEQPNRSFLRRIGLRTDGNLYKCVWYGHGLVGQHEKKTRLHEGHDDLIQLVGALTRTKNDEQWAVIKKHFEVEQVVNYYAVATVLSHWDGFFNNYYAYHDVHGSGRWTLYPWDQDKTWGFHDGIRGYEVFHDMPLTFGMEGDAPPGWPKLLPAPPGFGFGAVWWRPGGHLSRPLLANPTFRALFLARTRELVQTVYTEEVFAPVLRDLEERLAEEVRVRAEVQGGDPKAAAEHLRRNLASLREHLTRRRKFLLEQDEIRKAGTFDRTLLR